MGSKGGVPVTVKDVARVSAGYAPRQGIVSRNADEDAVEGIVLMRRGENPSVVLKALRERIDDINQRVLSQGTRIRPFYDRTELIDTTLRTVFHNLMEGALLVVLVLFLFMLSIKASLIVAAVIPLSLLASFLLCSQVRNFRVGDENSEITSASGQPLHHSAAVVVFHRRLDEALYRGRDDPNISTFLSFRFTGFGIQKPRKLRKSSRPG